MTGGTSAANRAAGVPTGPAEPQAAPTDAVIRAVPSDRPPRPTLVPGSVPPPEAGPEVGSTSAPRAPVPPEPETTASSASPAEAPAVVADGDADCDATDGRRPGGRPAGWPERKGRPGPGARELRHQETRARIVDAAAELFAERGFDAVSVLEIARRAGVVEKTVFNHFPGKEGLVFEADPPIRAALLDAVRRRPVGESVAAAAGNFVVSAMTGLGSPQAGPGVAAMVRVVRGSRTLQVREREILGELTGALAGLIAEETGAPSGALEPWLAANAVLGLYAALLELARDRVLEGVSGTALSAELLDHGRRGLALLQFGLAGYAQRG